MRELPQQRRGVPGRICRIQGAAGSGEIGDQATQRSDIVYIVPDRQSMHTHPDLVGAIYTGDDLPPELIEAAAWQVQASNRASSSRFMARKRKGSLRN